MKWIVSITSLFLIFLLTACANAPDLSMIMEEPTLLSTRPVPTLKIFSQENAFPPAIIADFETQFQAKVSYTTATQDESGLADIQAGLADYDLVVLRDLQVGWLRNEGLFAPLNRANIPNLKNIDPAFLNPLYDPGNRYCLPFQWGSMGLGYNRQTLNQDVQGWADFFRAERPLRLGLPDDSRLSLAAALLYLGNSPNTTSEMELTEADQLWQKHVTQVVIYPPGAGPALLSEGQVDLLFARSGAILQLAQTNPAVTYVIPDEGSLLWVDNLCLLKSSSQPQLVENFINTMLDPQIGAALAQTSYYSSPSQAVLALLNPADRANPVLYPPDELRQKLFFLVNVDPLTGQQYEQTWANLVAAQN